MIKYYFDFWLKFLFKIGLLLAIIVVFAQSYFLTFIQFNSDSIDQISNNLTNGLLQFYVIDNFFLMLFFVWVNLRLNKTGIEKLKLFNLQQEAYVKDYLISRMTLIFMAIFLLLFKNILVSLCFGFNSFEDLSKLVMFTVYEGFYYGSIFLIILFLFDSILSFIGLAILLRILPAIIKYLTKFEWMPNRFLDQPLILYLTESNWYLITIMIFIFSITLYFLASKKVNSIKLI